MLCCQFKEKLSTRDLFLDDYLLTCCLAGSHNYFFTSKTSSLDGRRKLQHMTQVCPPSSVSPKTSLDISSSFILEQWEHFHSKPVIGFDSCAMLPVVEALLFSIHHLCCLLGMSVVKQFHPLDFSGAALTPSSL